MTDGGEPTPGRLHRAVAATRLVLGWERLWQALWLAACVSGGFLALALVNILPQWPGWLHGLVLAAVATALALVLCRGFRGFRWPTEAEAVRRLERDNALSHRPLSTLRDRPATDDEELAAVWRRHCRQAVAQLGGVRVHWPRPGVAARDPFGVRAVVALMVVATAVGSRGDWLPRIAAALQPHLTSPGLRAPPHLDAWLVPPDYTGAAPIFLQRADAGSEPPPATDATGPAITVPAGSTVLARISGGSGLPTLTVNDSEQPFAAVDDDQFQAQQAVTGGSVIAVRQGGRTLGRWAIVVRPDQPPHITFAAAPAVSEHGTVRLDYAAADDYGLATVAATMRLAPEVAAAGGAPLVLPLPVPGLRPKTVHATSTHDLTASPWAGLPVLIELTATGGAGRQGHSAALPLVLPERQFLNPVAQKIVAQRRTLAPGGEAARQAAARSLGDLSIQTGAYHDDLVVFLALRVAVAQLTRERDDQSIPAVRDLLWETALRLEDGGRSLAERDLRDAEAALAEALDHQADDAEVRRRMDELQAAISRFLDTLEQQANQPDTPGGNQTPPGAAAQVLDRADLEAMMQALRDMAETGARDGARQALSNLGRLLDGLKSGASTPDPNRGATLEILRQLQDLTTRQRDLLDRTFRQSQGHPPEQDPTPSPPTRGEAPPAADQGVLRHQLGVLMQHLGDVNGTVPSGLGQAEQSMRAAEQALRRSDPTTAADAETQAVEGLQHGLRSLGQGLGLPGVHAGAQPGAGQDPLGHLRPGAGLTDSTDVGVPEAPELQRAREILDELRHRAGQRDRSRQELDYIDRLLRQF